MANDEDIIDAEWEEVPRHAGQPGQRLKGRRQARPTRPATTTDDNPWTSLDYWSSLAGPVVKALLSLVALIFILAIIAGRSPQEDERPTSVVGAKGQASPGSVAVAPPKSPPSRHAVILQFNAIGPYVNEPAGYVCEGERWVRPNENSIVWQGDNDEYLQFFYQFDGATMRLVNKETGKRTAFPMRQLSPGKWLVNGKVLQECAG